MDTIFLLLFTSYFNGYIMGVFIAEKSHLSNIVKNRGKHVRRVCD
jgi:hypothetical protein